MKQQVSFYFISHVVAAVLRRYLRVQFSFSTGERGVGVSVPLHHKGWLSLKVGNNQLSYVSKTLQGLSGFDQDLMYIFKCILFFLFFFSQFNQQSFDLKRKATGLEF